MRKNDDAVVLTGGRVAVPGEIRDDLVITVEGDRIAGVQPREHADVSAARIIDVGGRLIAPGLIDLHVHGGFGWAFDQVDQPGGADAAADLLRRMARSGVTSLQASLVSAEMGALLSRVDGLARVKTPDDGTALLGVHLEGPFLAAAQCGAHDPAVLRAPAAGDVAALLERAEAIRMITIAPELPGAIDAVRRFAQAGIVVAAGHSESTSVELAAAVDAGLGHITHLWSGQSTVTRRGPWRVPGLLEASLASNALTAEVIADGKHLPAELLEIARRCLGERLVVVSDGTEGTGMPTGYRYGLGTVTCEVGDGVGIVVGADAFGGSTSTVAEMLAHLHGGLGWPLPEVIELATSRPAAVAGVSDRKGTIAAGMDADLAVFDPNFQPWATMLRGRWLPATSAP